MSELSNERKAYLLQKRREKITVRTAQIAALLALFILWELAARRGLIDAFIMSSPSRVWETLRNLALGGELWQHLAASVWETAVGFLLGTALGTLIAVALWWWPTLARICDPYLVVLGALPKTALGPIFIVWMGAGRGAIIAMTLAISLIVTVMEVYNGFLATEEGKLRLLRTLGASRRQLLWHLVLPANFPTLVNALKVNVGLSWVGVIMGEFLVSREGLGYLIVYGSQVFKMDLVMATVLLLACAAAIMYESVLLLEKALKKYLGVSV